MNQIQSMGLLGGFLLTTYIKAERKSVTVDAQMTSPKMFHFDSLNDVKQGPKSIAVPGFLKGLWEIHQKFGSLSWRELIEPTMSLCNAGITLSKHLYDSSTFNKRIVNDPYLRELLVDQEKQKFKRPGSRIINKKHCKFLETLANHTKFDIYSDEVGEMLASDLKDAGSFISVEDLKDYNVKWSETVEFPMSGGDTLLLPNTAAVLIPSVLNILKNFNFNSSSFDSELNLNETILTHHRIVEAFKHVFAVRSQLGDPDFVDVKQVVDHILSENYAQDVSQKIDDRQTFSDPEKYSAKFIAPEDHGTSHISIVAANGDAVSVTSSINY